MVIEPVAMRRAQPKRTASKPAEGLWSSLGKVSCGKGLGKVTSGLQIAAIAVQRYRSDHLQRTSQHRADDADSLPITSFHGKTFTSMQRRSGGAAWRNPHFSPGPRSHLSMSDNPATTAQLKSQRLYRPAR